MNRSLAQQGFLAAACTALFWAAAPARAAESAPADESPQHATRYDVRIFDPYIGKFRSKTFTNDETGAEFHYTIEYGWYDTGKTIVKFAIEMIAADADRPSPISEGFYAYDALRERLSVFGAFTRGGIGWGAIGAFDHETGAREVWVTTKGADGAVIHLRDAFAIVDENTWTNKTRIRRGDDPEWNVVYEDTYTRIEE